MQAPHKKELRRPLLELLADGELQKTELIEGLKARLALPEEVWEERIPSGPRRIADRADWALLELVKTGLVKRVRRGVFRISEDGKDAVANGPGVLDHRFLRRYPAYAAWSNRFSKRRTDDGERADLQSDEEDISPKERIGAAYAAAQSALEDELLSRLRDGTSEFFERAVVELLLAMGYGRGRDGAGQQLGRSGDGGIDGVIDEDALGLDAVYVQAKRYAADNTVGRPAIQQFIGSLTGEGAAKGVFVTTSAFSAGARDYAAKIPQRVVLIDGPEFARLMIAHGVGVRPVETITLHEIDENFFAET